MGFFTRKNKKKNALSKARNVEEHAAYEIEHKHSKVGNILREPGKLMYTNVERIKEETEDEMMKIADKYDVDIDEIKEELKKEKMEPEKLVDAAKELKEIVESEMNSKNSTVTITISRGLAKVLLVILNIAVFFVVTFVGLASTFVALGAASAGVASTAGLDKFWDWVFKGKWIIGFDTNSKNKNNMKYTNNPMKLRKN
jgi:hypothetical protein